MFDDFLKELAKPSWWIGVVVVGFLINLASAYTKPLIDKTLGKVWLSSKEAAERKEALIIERARKLLDSPLLVVELKLDILKHTLRAIFFTATAIVCFLFVVLSQNKSLVPLLAFPFDLKSFETMGNTLLLIFGAFQLAISTLICHGFLELSGSVAHELSAFSILKGKRLPHLFQDGMPGGRLRRPVSDFG